MTQIIQLPQPAPLELSLGSALAKRRTNRQCTSEALSDEALAALLWACAGITAEDGRRTVPSTLDLRAVSAYVLRADGAWRFDAEKNCLEQTTDEDVRELSTSYQFDYVKTAPVTIVFVADANAQRQRVRRAFSLTRARWASPATWPPRRSALRAACAPRSTTTRCATA